MGRPPKQKNEKDERPVTPPPGMGIGGGFDVKVTRIERKPEGVDGVTSRPALCHCLRFLGQVLREIAA